MKIKRHGKYGNYPMILITGGLGYLGGRIAKNLINQGFDLRLTTSRDIESLPSILNKVELVKINLLDANNCEEVCKGVTSILHLASMNAQQCEKNDKLALKVNGLGTLNLLKAAEKKDVDNFLFFSTTHVYGDAKKNIFDENTVPIPKHPYSKTKRIAEDYVLNHNRKRPTNGIVLRLSNAIGTPIIPDTNCWMLFLNDICREAVEKNTITIQSCHDNKRDFIPISSVIDLVGELVLSSKIISPGQIINVCSGRLFSLKEIAEIVCNRMEVLFGYKPLMKVKSADSLQKIKHLKISNEKMLSLDIKFDFSLIEEIDGLLLNCKKWFS